MHRFLGASLISLTVGLLLVPASAHADASAGFDDSLLQTLEWREVGPYRGGRSAAVAGIPNQRDVYYFGATGGGV